ncbi:ragulator complex protein LAMTOR3 [Neocloeon triangulifer]|uniref:ragulator complex protein LAMTOR3 n=1 Tax=Neocloeon triangulifer TaxID=2078957 RepID=UPI00286F0760|nr:ragulator complex protein LAMTOR3 [Neocloeon triangulifer]
MVEDMNKYLRRLLSKVDGLYCIIISDRDGVPVLKVSTDDAPDKAMRTNFLSTFGIATDQGGKLGLGKTKSIICMYENFQVIQMNKLPLVVTFVTNSACNTGHVLALEPQLEPLLPVLRGVVGDT